jgi:catechol 2,3-dioxygenase-like lactoylglutathione lyase family enzyme
MEESIISGIQQIGIGVRDAKEAFRWYRQNFGMDVPVFEDEGRPVHMVRYTGGVIQARRAILAANLRGGGGFEIWQYTSRAPRGPSFVPGVGDLGILWPTVKAPSAARARAELLGRGARVLTEVLRDPANRPHFFVADPYGNHFQVVEAGDWFARGAGRRGTSTGGVAGCVLGVSDTERSLRLYRDVLGYDKVLSDTSGVFPDLSGLPGGDRRVRRTILTHAGQRVGPFSRWLGRTTVELISPLVGMGRQILSGRFWGDLGFIHLCFDVRGMETLRETCRNAGFPFTVDSADSFEMGEAAGRFAYVEDPDGTLVELVETHRIPILKSLGWYLDLRRRSPRRNLPRLLVRAMGLTRVRD